MKKIISTAMVLFFILSLVHFALGEDNADGTSPDMDKETSVSLGTDPGPQTNKADTINVNDRVEAKGRMRGRIESMRDRDMEERVNNIQRMANLSKEDMEKAAVLGRGMLKEIMRQNDSNLRNELRSIKIMRVMNADDLAERRIDEGKLKIAREKFIEAKENFEMARAGLEVAKKRLKEARERRNDNETIEYAKGYLLNISELLVSHLEKIRSAVQENKNIADDLEAKIVAEIDAQISEIRNLKSEIESATTKEQLKSIAKKLRQKWNYLKNVIKHHSERIVSSRVEGIINRGVILEKRLDKVLEEANANGTQINVSSEIAAFSEKISASRDYYRQAQSKLAQVLDLRANGEPADSEKIKTLLNEADELLKSSRQSLKDAFDMLKEIVNKIKESIPGANISSEVEVEVADEK